MDTLFTIALLVLVLQGFIGARVPFLLVRIFVLLGLVSWLAPSVLPGPAANASLVLFVMIVAICTILGVGRRRGDDRRCR